MHRAFTLIELVAVIIVLAILSAVVVPKYVDHSQRARVAVVANEFRTIRQALINYNRDNGAWPADTATWGSFPPGLQAYLDPQAFAGRNAIDGQYDWNGPPFHAGSEHLSIGQIVGNPSPMTNPVMLGVDAMLDDGNLSTGLLRWHTTYGFYAYFMR